MAAAQRRALQQRAARQGAMLVPGAAEGAVVKVGGRRRSADELVMTGARPLGWPNRCHVPEQFTPWLMQQLCGLACMCRSTGQTRSPSSLRQGPGWSIAVPVQYNSLACMWWFTTPGQPCQPCSASCPLHASSRTVVLTQTLLLLCLLQEVYRAALFSVFFGQVLLAGALPRIGEQSMGMSAHAVLLGMIAALHSQTATPLCESPHERFSLHAHSCAPQTSDSACSARPAGPALNFLLLSWLYALYCFDYKWALHSVQLQQRITYFERHWAFFLGGRVGGKEGTRPAGRC